jgi:hypothetical protein
VDRLARLLSLRRRLELEIAAAEAQLASQEAAVARLRVTYSLPEITAGRDRAGRRFVAVCGTDSGYYKHRRRLKEPACDPCRIAHAEAERDRAARARND